MTLQEQMFQASDTYEKSRWSHGVIDPVVLDEIGDAYFQGAEYGYKLAAEKACEWVENELQKWVILLTFDEQEQRTAIHNTVGRLKKTMERGEQ